MRWYQRFFRREVTEKQLDAELRFHLDQRIADLVATGIAPEEACRRARLEFGGLVRVKEEYRDVASGELLGPRVFVAGPVLEGPVKVQLGLIYDLFSRSRLGRKLEY
jgi:hypothetical protein